MPTRENTRPFPASPRIKSSHPPEFRPLLGVICQSMITAWSPFEYRHHLRITVNILFPPGSDLPASELFDTSALDSRLKKRLAPFETGIPLSFPLGTTLHDQNEGRTDRTTYKKLTGSGGGGGGGSGCSDGDGHPIFFSESLLLHPTVCFHAFSLACLSRGKTAPIHVSNFVPSSSPSWRLCIARLRANKRWFTLTSLQRKGSEQTVRHKKTKTASRRGDTCLGVRTQGCPQQRCLTWAGSSVVTRHCIATPATLMFSCTSPSSLRVAPAAIRIWLCTRSTWVTCA